MWSRAPTMLSMGRAVQETWPTPTRTSPSPMPTATNTSRRIHLPYLKKIQNNIRSLTPKDFGVSFLRHGTRSSLHRFLFTNGNSCFAKHPILSTVLEISTEKFSMVGLSIENAYSVPLCERFSASPSPAGHQRRIDPHRTPHGSGYLPRLTSQGVWKRS